MRPSFLLRHLRVDHAAAGGHPLHAAVLQQALVAGAVAVAHAAGDHVGDGLEAAVRMVGKAGEVVVGLVAAERVEHQERIEAALQRVVEHARQFHAGAVGSGAAGDETFDAAAAECGCGSHGRAPSCRCCSHSTGGGPAA
jgi:hypothetical protein